MPTPAAPTLLSGARSYGGTTGPLAGLLPLVYGDKIWKWWIDRFPTASIVMKVGTVPTPSPLFSHPEQDEVPYFLNTAAAITAASTDFGTGTSSAWNAQVARIVAGNVYMNTTTNERVLVLGGATTGTVPTATNITVQRGWGAIPAQAAAVGEKWILVGTNFGEGDVAPPSLTTQEVLSSFRIADFRDAVDITDRARGTEYMVEKDLWKREVAMKRFKQMRDIKLSYFFGGGGRITGATAAITNVTSVGELTGVTGLIDHVTTNVWDLNGNILTQPDLFDFIGSGIAPNNPERVLTMSTSAHVINIVNQWALDRTSVNAESPIKGWGVDLDHVLVMGGRKVALVEETEFNNDPKLRGMAFIGAPQTFSKWRPFKGNGVNGETTFYDDILKENHPTRRKGEWYTSGGWEHFMERGWGFIKGIVA
jgi:hypothetical protein